MNQAQAIDYATQRLLGLEGVVAAQEARWLVELAQESDQAVAGLRPSISAPGGAELGSGWLARLESWLGERARGVPFQHVVGEAQFLTHRYRVSPAVLIPRPETEALVERILAGLGAPEFVGDTPRLGLEIGVGSGVIAIEMLAAQGSRLHMHATELDPAAAEIAWHNAQRILGPDARSLELLLADNSAEIWEPIERSAHAYARVRERGGYDCIVSNPPYVATESECEPSVLQYEPRLALFAPTTSYFYERLADEAAAWLRPEGRLWCELPHERAHSIADLFHARGWGVELSNDLSGRPRVLAAHRPIGVS